MLGCLQDRGTGRAGRSKPGKMGHSKDFVHYFVENDELTKILCKESSILERIFKKTFTELAQIE